MLPNRRVGDLKDTTPHFHTARLSRQRSCKQRDGCWLSVAPPNIPVVKTE